jgi:hypothetical protein
MTQMRKQIFTRSDKWIRLQYKYRNEVFEYIIQRRHYEG